MVWLRKERGFCAPQYGVQRGKGQKEEDIIAFLAECFELPEAQARECYQRIAQGEAL